MGERVRARERKRERGERERDTERDRGKGEREGGEREREKHLSARASQESVLAPLPRANMAYKWESRPQILALACR